MYSLCITTYNRYELLLESFSKILEDDRISEIVVVDDASKPEIVEQLRVALSEMPKIKFYVNETNLGMSRNKVKAIELASNPWCIIFDSDNVIDSSYLDALPQYITPSVIYCPDFAQPQFDYRKFGGRIINSDNVHSFVNKPLADCLLNTCNYLVNREEYLRVYEYNENMKGTDTIWFNYLWLKTGNSFNVVPGMQYFHRVHNASGFLEDCEYNMKQAQKVKDLIKTLR